MTQFLRTPWHLVSTVAAIGVLLTACNKGQQAAPAAAVDPPAAATVAVVNGVAIPRADYDAFLKNLLQGKPVPPDLTAEQKNQVLDELITMELVSAQGLKDGVDKDPEVAANLTNLAALLRNTGESIASDSLLKRALAIYESRLGANSPQARGIRESPAKVIARPRADRSHLCANARTHCAGTA